MGNEYLSRFQWLADDKQGENFVTTIEELETPLPLIGSTVWADEVRQNFPMTCVGCMANDNAPHVTSAKAPNAKTRAVYQHIDNSFPTRELEAAKARGARVILVAL